MESPASKGQTVEEKDRLEVENVASRYEHQVAAPAPAPIPAPVLAPAPAPDPDLEHSSQVHNVSECRSELGFSFPLPGQAAEPTALGELENWIELAHFL